MGIMKLVIAGLAILGLAGCVETMTVGEPAAPATPPPSVTAKSGGGADARFPSGCWVTYDEAGNRGGHVGACTDAEFASADRAAGRFLGGYTTPASVASDDLSAFVGARAGQAEGGLQARGYEPTRTKGLTTFWFNRGTGSCARIVTSNGRYESVTMVPASNC